MCSPILHLVLEVFLYHLMRVVLLMGNSVNEVDSMRMDVFKHTCCRAAEVLAQLAELNKNLKVREKHYY